MCEIDTFNLRALWGLFFCNQFLAKKDQGNDKIQALSTMCTTKVRQQYQQVLRGVGGRANPCAELMLEVLSAETITLAEGGIVA